MQGNIHSIESFGTVDGPGTRFVVFLQGCPMRCAYCHNPDTWALDGGNKMEPEEIFAQYRRNITFYKSGGITVTGGEPLLQLDFLIALFTIAKAESVHTCIDTSGVVFDPENQDFMTKLNQLMKLTDLVMLDIKHIDPQKHFELTANSNEQILAFAAFLNDLNIDMWIRHVVVPGLTDEDEWLFQLGYRIGEYRNLKALDVLPYHTMGAVKYQSLGMKYRLEGVPNMDKTLIPAKKQVIIDGIKKKRAEMEEQH